MRRVYPFYVAVPAALFLAFACGPPPAPKAPVAGTDVAAPPGPPQTSNLKPQTSNESPPVSPPPASKDTGPATKPPNASEVPADLKSDGYYYYSLAYDKPMKIELRISGSPEIRTGTQTISLKSIDHGVPVYRIERSGGLADLGEQELKLTKEGLLNTASTIAKVTPHDIEMPAKLAPGTTWPSHTEIEQGATPMSLDSVFRVVGMEKVQTPAGEHQAMLITSTGKGTIGGKKVTTTFKGWFVKDLGNVKTILGTTYSDGTKREITMQETK